MLIMWESSVQGWAPMGRLGPQWEARDGWGWLQGQGSWHPEKEGAAGITGPWQGGGPSSDEWMSARRAWYHPPTTSPGTGGLLKFQTNHSNTFIGCPLSFSAGQGHCIGSYRVTFFNGNLLPYTAGSEVTPALGSRPEVRRKCLCYLCQGTSCLCFVFLKICDLRKFPTG